MAKLFVTGAGEYVCAFFVERALRKCHQVTLIHATATPVPSDVNFQVRDAAKASDYSELLRDHNAIIHLDARPEACAGIIAAARNTGVKRILYLSRLGARPQCPVTSFATHFKNEQALQASGLDVSIFKPAPIYGPKELRFTELVNWLRRFPFIPYVQGWGMLQPVDVYDLVAFMLATVENSETIGHRFEIGGTERVSMGQLIDVLIELQGGRTIKWAWFTNYAQWLTRRVGRLPFPFWRDIDDVLMHNEQLICNMRGLPYQFKIQLSPMREGLKQYYFNSTEKSN